MMEEVLDHWVAGHSVVIHWVEDPFQVVLAMYLFQLSAALCEQAACLQMGVDQMGVEQMGVDQVILLVVGLVVVGLVVVGLVVAVLLRLVLAFLEGNESVLYWCIDSM